MRTDTQTVPFLDLAAQNGPLRAQLDAAIARVVDAGAFVLGPALRSFEEAFATYCEAPHCVGVNSGTMALQLMLQGAGIGPGDEVITAPNTFIATVEAILASGATPVLADVDPTTWLLDPAAVEARITARTRALLPVHLYGFPCDLEALGAVAREHGLLLLEDAAQAHGARHKGARVGHGSTAAAFSFYPGKNLGAFGDGGAVITDDPELARQVEALRHHGQLEKNRHALVGTTGRLDSLQAAVLEVKLAHLDRWNESRRHLARRYRERLAGTRYRMPEPLEGAEPVYHLFVVVHPEVEKVHSLLGEHGVGFGAHYPLAVHQQPAFEDLGRPGEFPVAEEICNHITSLPIFAELGEDQVDRVCDVLLKLET
jgi:dTDP-4-amino-4,6-dideoxygalactose transaminase